MKRSGLPRQILVGVLLALAGCLAVIGAALVFHRFGPSARERAARREIEALQRALDAYTPVSGVYPPGYRPPSPSTNSSPAAGSP